MKAYQEPHNRLILVVVRGRVNAYFGVYALLSARPGGHSWAGGREAVALVPGVPPVAVQPDLPLRPDNLPEGEHLQPGQGVVHQLVPRGVHVGIVPCHWGGVPPLPRPWPFT